ncbi:endopeptidase La [Candidatus Parcubacteria bacterium]|nr:endopeptidase La [Candidatus Parcubacteria bacterium]
MSSNKQNIYPSITLRKAVVFPAEKVPLVLEGTNTAKAIKSAVDSNRLVALVFKKDHKESQVGVVAKILQHWYLTPLIVGLTVEGLKRVKIARGFSESGIEKVEAVELIPETQEETAELEALSRHSFDQFKKLIKLEGTIPLMIASELQKDHLSFERTSDVIASALSFEFEEKLELLETFDIKKRLEIISIKLAKEIQIAETEKKIKSEVERKINKTQKEFILREQIKAIEKELGIFEEQKEYSELEQKIKRAMLPKPVERNALKELYRLRRMPPVSAEAPYIRAYLDWIVELPWSKKSKTKINLEKAKTILDEDHYGLEKAKERVLEYLAVQKLTKGKGRGSILCFVGPPGTGKTSVGRSIAKALGRSFVRISLGGIRDEAEIRGHRRTYVGALPGRIIQAMKTAGAKNPVFMMDEIDKVGADFRGDPSAALLEVLDPEQNNSFSDHYLEMPFDLSEVFFITTANILDPIPPALRDRMEVIEFPGYTDEEKFHIAKKFLLHRVFSSHGLDKKKLWIEENTTRKIVSKYTREAGVRNLERKIAQIARKVAKKIAENGGKEKIIIDESSLPDYLGPEEFKITMREAKDEIGISTGMAWTAAGGEIIFIEAALVPGKGVLTLTGQLGETMQESAKAALSYIRSRSKELGFNSKFFQNSDIHIHVPSGAIPKDGPSAGIAIAVALASVLTKRKVKKEAALTGEITLSGKVLEVGGIKEKVLSAHRAGVKLVVLPKDNEKNLVDVPEEIKKELKFKFVSHMDDVLKTVLKK